MTRGEDARLNTAISLETKVAVSQKWVNDNQQRQPNTNMVDGKV